MLPVSTFDGGDVCVLCGCALWVWAWREPWVEIEEALLKKYSRSEGSPDAPDGRRWAERGDHFVDWFIYEKGKDWPYRTLYRFPRRIWGHVINDNTIRLQKIEIGTNNSVRATGWVTYKRRFPQWWWGHFYHLETWMLAIVSAMLIRIALSRELQV